MRLFPVSLFAALGTVVSSSNAATLVNYVDGSASSLAASETAANVISTSLANIGQTSTLNLGTSGVAVRSDYGATSTAEIAAAYGAGKSYILGSATNRDGTDTTAPAAADLVTDANFFSFSLTAASTYSLSLDTLGFSLGVLSNTGAMSTAIAYQVYASVNGGAYAEVGATVLIASTSYASGIATALPDQSVDLTGLNALGPITSVDFRIWQGTTLDSDSTLALGYQDINIQGSVIPEPAAGLLGLLGVASLVLRRKR